MYDILQDESFHVGTVRSEDHVANEFRDILEDASVHLGTVRQEDQVENEMELTLIAPSHMGLRRRIPTTQHPSLT